LEEEYFNGNANIYGVLKYFLVVVLISAIVNLFPSYWLEEITANVSSIIFSNFGLISSSFSNELNAYIQVGDGVKSFTIEIVRECTGIHVIAIFTGLVLPLKQGEPKRKLLAILLASVILFLLNITRVLLTIGLIFFDVFPFSVIFLNPTVETFHYPLSYLYGVFGVFLLIISVDRLVLPELGDALVEAIVILKNSISNFILSLHRMRS
jgi:exosortase/archaeosortase family protein